MVACPRKSIVSYFWITTFAVFAAQYAADNVIKIINAYGIRGGLSYLGVPFIFYVTLLRFSIGNILHIRQLEKKGLSPYIWLYDFSVIFLESLIFLFLGACTWGNDIRFLKLLLILCFVDVFWIMSMIPHYVKKKRPEPLPWAWGLLNIAGAAYLAATIWCDLPIPLTGPYGHAFFVLWFLSSAIIDIILIDHYKLLKALD
jgi:hypothetical protein